MSELQNLAENEHPARRRGLLIKWTPAHSKAAAAPARPADERVSTTETTMTSTTTAHHAVAVGQGYWAVDWLPGRSLNTKQASAAIHLAAALRDCDNDPGAHGPLWAAALSLTLPEARGLAKMPCPSLLPNTMATVPAAEPQHV